MLEFLTQPRREVSTEWLKNSSNSQSIMWLHTVQVKKWSDFTFENIELAYGPFLHGRARVTNPRWTEPWERPVNESGVVTLAESWTYRIVRHAIRFTQAKLTSSFDQADVSPVLIKTPTLMNEFHDDWYPRTRGGREFYPDLQISDDLDRKRFYKDEPKPELQSKPSIFVMGDAKTSSSWSYTEFLKFVRGTKGRNRTKQPDDLSETITKLKETVSRNQNIGPLDQISTYCIAARTQYGFLYTDQIIAICRVWTIPGENGSKKPSSGVAIMPVSWNENKDSKLSPELALWAILMMSLVDRHRGVVNNDGPNQDLITWHRVPMPREFERLQGPDVGIYRHKLSGVERHSSQLKDRGQILLEHETDTPTTYSWTQTYSGS